MPWGLACEGRAGCRPQAPLTAPGRSQEPPKDPGEEQLRNGDRDREKGRDKVPPFSVQTAVPLITLCAQTALRAPLLDQGS